MSDQIQRVLIDALQHDDAAVRDCAARASIGFTDFSASIARLEPLLEDSSPAVRKGAVSGLAMIAAQDDSAFDLLIKLLAHHHPEVRASAARVLPARATSDNRAAEVLRALGALKDDPDCNVRSSGVSAIARLHTRDAAWDFIEEMISETDSCIRIGALVGAYYRSDVDGTPYPPLILETLIDALGDHNGSLRRLAASIVLTEEVAVQFVDYKEELQRLSEHDDPIVKNAVLEVLDSLANR